MSAPTVNPSMEQPRPSTRTQWWVLTMRFIAPALRNGELITAIGASVGFTVGFYIPFSIPWNHFVGGGSSGVASNLGQYITPLIITAGRRVRRHFIGLPGGNRFAAGRQSTVQVHADRPIDAGACPRVSQRVPMLRWFDGIADLRPRDRIPVPSRSPLHCRFLRIGDRDRGLAVIRLRT